MSVAEIQPNDFAFVYLDIDKLSNAWLTYRGRLVSSDQRTQTNGQQDSFQAPSFFLFNTLVRGVESTLEREGRLEGCRRVFYPDRLSRLSSIFAFPSIESAEVGLRQLGKYNPENLVAITPIDDKFRCETYDMGWITNFNSLGPDAAQKYWSGEGYPGEDSQREMLLSGRFLILGTSVRQRAYQTIKDRDPKSLYLLELGRLAVTFDSDLGEVLPWIHLDEGQLRGSFIVKYDATESLKIQRKTHEELLKDPSFAVNWADLGSPEDKVFNVPNDPEFRTVKLEKFKILLAEMQKYISAYSNI